MASTHAFLMFFTNKGKVYWHKVYGLPQLSRDAKGRALVNLLHLDEGEVIQDCLAVKDYDLPDHYLMMATKKGLVKKTVLKAYRRPLKAGLIAIKLREGDELIDACVCGPNDEILLSTAKGQAIRFRQSDVRPMGRNSSGVKGISLRHGDSVVGMVVADENATLLTVCANGYGKRTPFGPNAPALSDDEPIPEDDDQNADQTETDADSESEDVNSTRSYRVQRRGGGGIKDIKATKRNGPVIAIVPVTDGGEVMMMTARGKIQRISVDDISIVGRNTQGVRVMNVDDGDELIAVKPVPSEDAGVVKTGESED